MAKEFVKQQKFDPYMDWRKQEHIYPLTIPNKEKYYKAIANIDHSFSGIIGDGNTINTFIMEAAQLLVNSIELFELGYFDCAYYSLRSAIEMSTTMVFLTDMPQDEKEKYLERWKDTAHFPMQGQIVRMLSEKGSVFFDMKEKMPSFFSNARGLQKDLDKYVHKQGLHHFYVSRNKSISLKEKNKYIKEFENHLKKCIGIVAVMRLAGDAFPILLMDEDFFLRCFDSMTEAYSQEFVDEYIGNDIVQAYKETLLYQGTYEAFENDEKKNIATYNVMKYQFIDRAQLSDILEQIHMLDIYDTVSVLLVYTCEKIAKVYTFDGFQMYYTDLKTARIGHSWDGTDFQGFKQNTEKFNQIYDEAFISVFHCLDEYYYVEHNVPLDNDDILNISDSLTDFEKKMKKAIEEYIRKDNN